MLNPNKKQTIVVSPESLNELKRQSLLFEQTSGKLAEQDKVLFDMIGNALRRKDNLRANMYANELTRVRHLKRVFSQCQLVIECIAIRMENLLDLYNAIQMEPVSQVIKEVIGEVQGVSPEFATGLEQLTKLASDTLKQTTISFKQPALDEIFSVKNPEGVAILQEVSSTIENRLQESFPEPPISKPQAVTQQAEVISYGDEPTFPTIKAIPTDKNDLNILSDDLMKMLNGITKNNNKIDDVYNKT